MSRNIEENVVKMRFDNQEFDQNIEESQETVNKFKDTLTSLPQQIYIGLQNTLSALNLRDIIGIGAALGGIALVKNGVQSLGYEIQAICANTLGAINNVVNTAIYQINTGGKARAMNIENAKFQIEGLKLDVETFMTAADYAVSGTAYSLDAAAKVASQLGASGVTQLEELKAALRSVSGVAAMTNSSYEEIGNIYTTMASNGKLMTENIRSFSARGLNITANLAKALNKTEAEISDMVTKGKIDFKTFYTAMDEAFGEHAKDANKTFEGSMNNVRSALSRIGEGLWTPIIQNSIEVFNSLRLAINQFKAELADNAVYTTFAEHIKNIYWNAQNMIDLVKYAIENTGFMESLSNFFNNIFKIADEIFDAFSFDYSFVVDEIFNNISILLTKFKEFISVIRDAVDEALGIRILGGEFNSLVLWVSRLLQSLEQINMLDLKDVFISWFKAVKSVWETVSDILGIKKDNITAIFDNVVKTALDLFKQLKLSDERIDKITRTFRGFASALDIVKMLVVSIYNFIKPIFDYIPTVVDYVLSITATIGDAIYEVRNAIKENEVFDKLLQNILKVAIFLKEVIEKIGTNFFEAFFGDETEGTRFIDRLLNFVNRLAESLAGAFDNLDLNGVDLSPIADFLRSLASFGLSEEDGTEAEDNLNWVTKLFNKIKSFFTMVGDFFSNTIFGGNENFSKLNEFIESVSDGLGTFMDHLTGFVSEMNIDQVTVIAVTALIYEMLKMIKEIILAFFDFVLQLTAIFTGTAANAGSTLDKLLDKTMAYIDKIGIGSSLFSKLHTLFQDIGAMNLQEIFHGYKNKDTFTSALTSIADVLKAFGLAMIEIAVALFVVALIPKDRLQTGVDVFVQLITMLGIIIGALVLVTNISNSLKITANLNASLIKVGGVAQSPLFALAGIIGAFGLMFVEIAAALFVITQLCDTSKVDHAVEILYTMIAIISTVIFSITLIFQLAKVDGSMLAGMTGVFISLGLVLLAIAAAVAVLSLSFKSGEEGKIWTAVLVIGALMLVIGAIIGFTTFMAEGNADVPLTVGAGLLMALVGFIGVIAAIAGALLILSQIDKEALLIAGAVLGILVTIIGGIAILAVAVGGLVGDMGPQALAGMAIALGALIAMGDLIVKLVPVISSVALVVASFALVVNAIKDFIKMLSELDALKVDNIIDNTFDLLIGISSAIPVAVFTLISGAIDSMAQLFPIILKFVKESVIPFIMELFDIMVPASVKKLLESFSIFANAIISLIPVLIDLLSDIFLGSGSLLTYIFDIIDAIWDTTIDWINERIPVVVDDIFKIIITLIKAVNLALGDNWDELDEELQKLIDQTIKLASDLLTGEQTWDQIDEAFEKLFEHLKDVIEDNKDVIGEAFRSLGQVIGQSIFEGLVESLPEGKIKDWILGETGYNDITNTSPSGSLAEQYGIDTNFDLSSLIGGINNGIDLSNIDVSNIPGQIDIDSLNALNNNRTINNNVNVRTETTVDLEGSVKRLFKANVYEGQEQRRSGRLAWN